MKRNKFLGLAVLAIISSTTATAQVEVNYEKYPDYSPLLKPDYSLAWHAKNKMSRATTLRPSHVNNAERIYFPAPFNQDGGSCGSASRIGYMFSYEINAFRGTNASLEENQYPTHFTWLLTNSNSGKEGMAATNGIPRRTTYGGLTYSRFLGNQDCADPDFGWMQGYDKWYEAMNNRILRSANFPQNVNTEAGREAVKNWIWNHNGDEDFYAGGICGIGVASACTQASIPNTPTNAEAKVVGMKYVSTWGTQVDHALTIVGYDDRIEFDLDGNGKYGEVAKDEVGAWIIVNSWGGAWANKGFIYCPYKYGCPVGTSGDYWTPEIYYVRKSYRPLRTIKIKMDYSKRSELCIGAGISANINATEPEQSIQFDHFKYAGDGDGNGVDAETPMLGKWLDGMHYEPMEFGYDLTDISQLFDTRKPLKYFLIIDSKATASGEGKVYNASIIDYEFDKAGVELPFDINAEGVTVETAGNRTIISMVVMGEPVNSPRNLSYANYMMSWNTPQASIYPVKSYNIYKGNQLFTTVPENKREYSVAEDTAAIYSVSANYDVAGTTIESVKSNSITGYMEKISRVNSVRTFPNSGFDVPGVFDTRYSNATIEYWIRPLSLRNWNQQIGPGWAKFLIHTTGTGQLVAGWATGSNRIDSKNNVFNVGVWAHVAVVVENNRMTAYVNGESVGSITSTDHSGIGGFGDLRFGSNGNPMDAAIDELRIWSVARTQEQIKNSMRIEIANPVGERNLLAYYRMDEKTVDGVAKLRDAARGQHATYTTTATHNVSVDTQLFSQNDMAKASFIMPEPPYYAGQELQFIDNSISTTQAWEWTADGTGVNKLNVQSPFITFPTPGDYTIKLKVKSGKGTEADTTATIQIEKMPVPKADFTMTTEHAAAGERISFLNKSVGTGCTYEWILPGANVEKVTTANAAAVYATAGDYMATLKITNASGTDVMSKNIKVSRVAPKADFNIRPTVVIKGQTVYLEDKSSCDPTNWSWLISSPKHVMGVDGQNSSLVPTVSGVYDVQQTAGNDLGKNSAIQKRALVVCNADAKNGLKFSGSGEKVSIADPFDSAGAGAFSIDYWMYPTRLLSSCNQMGDKAETLLITTNAEGTMSVTVGGKTAVSAKGFVIPSEWHHYAIIFNKGSFTFYRDGESISTLLIGGGLTCPVLVNGFTIGGDNAPMNAVIDEFRIWNTALSSRYVRQYNNEPISSEDMALAMSQRELLVYYQFNQNSGNVIDATTNARTGMRSGFGPEGDAWSSSLGVFCLNNESSKNANVTSKYLTNYKTPFLSTTEQISTHTSSILALETETTSSAWVIENSADNDVAKTQWGVNTEKEKSMNCISGWAGFASSLKDHKVYQTITLPAGVYEFSLTPFDKFDADSSYLVVDEGVGISSTPNVATSLAHAPLSAKSVTFMLSKETEVSLGVLVNLTGTKYITVKNFELNSKDSNIIEADGLTNLEGVVGNNTKKELTVYVNGSTVTLQTFEKILVSVKSVDGKLLYNKMLNGMDSISLAKGIYVINGKKIVVQ